MQNLGINYDYILDQSLKDLHEQCKNWTSELELWIIELTFFRKLIKRNYLKLEDEEEELEHYVELIDYYQVRMLKELKKKLQLHIGTLKRLIDKQPGQNEELFREEHKEIRAKIHTFQIEFRNLKEEFLTFIENATRE